MTAELLCYVKSCDPMGSLKSLLQQRGFSKEITIMSSQTIGEIATGSVSVYSVTLSHLYCSYSILHGFVLHFCIVIS